jgi:hypothetical protein
MLRRQWQELGLGREPHRQPHGKARSFTLFALDRDAAAMQVEKARPRMEMVRVHDGRAGRYARYGKLGGLQEKATALLPRASLSLSKKIAVSARMAASLRATAKTCNDDHNLGLYKAGKSARSANVLAVVFVCWRQISTVNESRANHKSTNCEIAWPRHSTSAFSRADEVIE